MWWQNVWKQRNQNTDELLLYGPTLEHVHTVPMVTEPGKHSTTIVSEFA